MTSRRTIKFLLAASFALSLLASPALAGGKQHVSVTPGSYSVGAHFSNGTSAFGTLSMRPNGHFRGDLTNGHTLRGRVLKDGTVRARAGHDHYLGTYLGQNRPGTTDEAAPGVLGDIIGRHKEKEGFWNGDQQ